MLSPRIFLTLTCLMRIATTTPIHGGKVEIDNLLQDRPASAGHAPNHQILEHLSSLRPGPTRLTGNQSTISGHVASVRLPTHAVDQTVAYQINITEVDGKPLCMYPTSSTWSLLPRILFYCTLVFALVAKAHEWLIVGALAAALTYSGLAALQMSFQVWTHTEFAEMDFIPMTGILAASCIIAVPLMNWSSTIRELGLPKEKPRPLLRRGDLSSTWQETTDTQEEREEKKKESSSLQEDEPIGDENKEYASTRTVLVFWGLLVTIGFLTAFMAIRFFASDADWITVFVTPEDKQFVCTPPNGTIDWKAGQLPDWSNFWITSEFVEANNCNDPCSGLDTVPLFRSSDELQTQGLEIVDLWFEKTKISPNEIRNFHFIVGYFGYMLFILPFALLQAVVHVTVFWRHTPQKARWTIFLWISNLKPDERVPEVWTPRMKFGFWTAALLYSISLLILILTPFAFVANVIITEIFMWYIPQSETNDHVDQWGVFAIAIMVFIATFICRLSPSVRLARARPKLEAKQRYFDGKIKYLEGSREDIPQLEKESLLKRLKKISASTFEALKHEIPDLSAAIDYKYRDMNALMAYERYTWKWFWKHPEEKPIPRKKADDKNFGTPEDYRLEQWCPYRWPFPETESPRSRYRKHQQEEVCKLREKLRKTKARYEKIKRDIEAGKHQRPAVSNYVDSTSPVSVPIPSSSQSSRRTLNPAKWLRKSSRKLIPRKPVPGSHLRPNSRTSLLGNNPSTSASQQTHELPSGDTTPFLPSESSDQLLHPNGSSVPSQQISMPPLQSVHLSAGQSYSPLQDEESEQYLTGSESVARSFIDDHRW